jgi:phage recombination protein Bet
MTTAIQPSNVLPMSVPGGSFFSDAQEQMILKTFLGGATKDEAVVLLETVRRRRLDPFSRQVYFVKRYDYQKREEVWAIQTSIDGLRSIADRTGHYEGQTKPEWCGEDGVWVDVWLKKEPPAAARVGVHKTGFREPAYGIARLDAYRQTKKDGSPTAFWIKMSDLMLAKCAEALALRKAFPEDTGGLYIAEEMGQNSQPEQNVTPAAPALPPDRGEVRALPSEAAKTVDAAPKKVPRPSALGLWDRLVRECEEDKGKALAKLNAAVTTHFGSLVPSTEWTEDDVVALKRELFDIAY